MKVQYTLNSAALESLIIKLMVVFLSEIIRCNDKSLFISTMKIENNICCSRPTCIVVVYIGQLHGLNRPGLVSLTMKLMIPVDEFDFSNLVDTRLSILFSVVLSSFSLAYPLSTIFFAISPHHMSVPVQSSLGDLFED